MLDLMSNEQILDTRISELEAKTSEIIRQLGSANVILAQIDIRIKKLEELQKNDYNSLKSMIESLKERKRLEGL